MLLVHVISLLVHTRRLLSDRIYLKLALFCSSVYIFQTRLVIVKQKVKLWYLKNYVTGTRGTERVYPETLIGSENGYFSVLVFRLQDNGVSFRTPKAKFLTFFIVLVWMDENGGFKYDDVICHASLVQRLPWKNGIVFCSFERFRVVCTGAHDSNTIRVDEKRRQIRCIQKYPDM